MAWYVRASMPVTQISLLTTLTGTKQSREGDLGVLLEPSFVTGPYTTNTFVSARAVRDEKSLNTV